MLACPSCNTSKGVLDERQYWKRLERSLSPARFGRLRNAAKDMKRAKRQCYRKTVACAPACPRVDSRGNTMNSNTWRGEAPAGDGGDARLPRRPRPLPASRVFRARHAVAEAALAEDVSGVPGVVADCCSAPSLDADPRGNVLIFLDAGGSIADTQQQASPSKAYVRGRPFHPSSWGRRVMVPATGRYATTSHRRGPPATMWRPTSRRNSRGSRNHARVSRSCA